MIFSKKAFGFALMIALTGCGTTYGPTGQYGGIPHGGYSETRVSANTFIVSYTGNSFVPLNKVENALLYRCAQLTVQNGFNYFVVLSTTTSNKNIHVKTSSTKHSIPRLPGTNYRSIHFDGYDVSKSQTAEPVTQQLHGSVAVIQLFQGSAPPNVPRAYTANDVLAHLGADL